MCKTKKKQEIINKRAKDFLECLGNGKTWYEIEAEEELEKNYDNDD